jgi:hypothetical protein
MIQKTVGNMRALFAQKALNSSSPILPQAGFPALPARGGASISSNPNNGWQAPETGRSPNSAEGCDHRGAGYTAFMLAGFATSGADVMPYVFEPFANGGSERCDMLENSLGLFTRHGLPKSTAAAHWAIDQMGWRSRWAA